MKPTRKYILFLEQLFPQRFLVAKITHVPILREFIEKMLFDKTNLTVLPKESEIEITMNKSIQPPDSIVLPSQVVEYFIRKTSHRFIMNFCICREAMSCKNHPINFGCLFLGEAVRDINHDLGKEVTMDEALVYAQKCRSAGLIHLIGRDKIDETWLGVGSKGKLLTICNCCSCCCLWKFLSDLDPHISSKVKRMPGVEVKVTQKCIGCGTCKESCYVRAISIQDKHAVISDRCKGCGRCAERCPQNAIQISINDELFIQKTIDRIESSVKV
jgi:ferredoxin